MANKGLPWRQRLEFKWKTRLGEPRIQRVGLPAPSSPRSRQIVQIALIYLDLRALIHTVYSCHPAYQNTPCRGAYNSSISTPTILVTRHNDWLHWPRPPSLATQQKRHTHSHQTPSALLAPSQTSLFPSPLFFSPILSYSPNQTTATSADCAIWQNSAACTPGGNSKTSLDPRVEPWLPQWQMASFLPPTMASVLLAPSLLRWLSASN